MEAGTQERDGRLHGVADAVCFRPRPSLQKACALEAEKGALEAEKGALEAEKGAVEAERRDAVEPGREGVGLD